MLSTPPPPTPSPTQKRFQTLDYLNSISGNKTVAGIQNRYNNNVTGSTQNATDWTNKTPALWGADFLYDYDNIKNRFKMIEEAKRQWGNGSIVSIMWHACNPALECPSNWTVGFGPRSNLTNDQWTDLITNGTGLNTNWTRMMGEIAVGLQDLQKDGVEVLFRPLHEMNQGAFWWAGRPGMNGTSRLYQITHDYFTIEKNLTNLIWVWDLQDFQNLTDDLRDYDPGPKYWDVLALDFYDFSTNYSVAKYDAMRMAAGGKPIAIGECRPAPELSVLEAQPLWTFFMTWAEETFFPEHNTIESLSEVYNGDQVITLDEKPKWNTSLE
jgi:mannan endo-1,4-beta-mannosidase